MNKKSKIILSIIILILLTVLIIIGYSSNDNKPINNGISEINKVDIQIDDSKLNIFYFYVGQADCTLIMNKGQTMLIDAGEKSDGEQITKFLNQIGITKIDYLVATHSDDDHIGGMSKIVQNFQVEKLYMPKKEASNEAYTDIIDVTIQKGLSIENVEKDSIINVR